jgi:hypothetical protein
VYVDGTMAGIGVALVSDQLGLRPGFGMSVGLVGQFFGPQP